MMRVLQARESLRRVTEIAAGNGLIKEQEREPIMREWRRAAKMDQDNPTTLDTLIGHGIGIEFRNKDGTRA